MISKKGSLTNDPVIQLAMEHFPSLKDEKVSRDLNKNTDDFSTLIWVDCRLKQSRPNTNFVKIATKARYELEVNVANESVSFFFVLKSQFAWFVRVDLWKRRRRSNVKNNQKQPKKTTKSVKRYTLKPHRNQAIQNPYGKMRNIIIIISKFKKEKIEFDNRKSIDWLNQNWKQK